MIVRQIRRRDHDKKKKVAAYCRVSTDKASQEESLETQSAAYDRLIRSNPEWEYAGIYSDEGKSATSAKHRTEFQRMIADALDGKIDIILVKSISRFSRNLVDCQTYVEQLREKGVSVRFERENIDSLNPASSLMFSLLAAIAQDESRSISENVKWGISRRYERGEYRINNNQVLGYDADEDGRPVPNEDAWIVQMIFRLFTEGTSVREVAELVTAAGGHGLRGHAPLSSQTIRYILKNEIYVGDRVLQKQAPVNYLTKKPDPQAEYKTYHLQNVHEPLIDRETWEKAQSLLRRRELDREAGVERIRADAHFLYGRLFCAQCGAPYKRRTFRESPARGGGSYKTWCCKERGKGKAGKGCTNPILREAELLEAITRKLRMETFDEQAFLRTVEKVLVQEDGEILIELLSNAA